jgi:transcriptional regulator NrdR family protein
MRCPYCANKTKIYNSRSTHSHTQKWRRHRCVNCNKTFTTRERIDWNDAIHIADVNGKTTPYSRERLLLSLLRAVEKLEPGTPTPVDICDTVEHSLQQKGFFGSKTQKSTVIAAEVLTILHRYDPNTALQYLNNLYQGKPPVELLKRYVTS